MRDINVPPPPPIVDQKKLAHSIPPPPIAPRGELPTLSSEDAEVAKEVEQLVKGSNAKDPRVKIMIKKLTKNNEKVKDYLKAKGILWRKFIRNKKMNHSREQSKATPLNVQWREAPWVAECACCDCESHLRYTLKIRYLSVRRGYL